VDTESFVALLNEDLTTEYQSIVQYVQHTAIMSGPEYLSVVAELKAHLLQELAHAEALAGQISFLGGTPTGEVGPVRAVTDTRDALQADLDLESSQLVRYRERFSQATDLGLVDVAEVLRPLLEQTQEHVRDLTAALGR
jgi:bacterioferritin